MAEFVVEGDALLASNVNAKLTTLDMNVKRDLLVNNVPINGSTDRPGSSATSNELTSRNSLINEKLTRRPPSSLSTVKKFLFGLIIVCMIACSWVGSTQSAKSSYNGGFAAPLFLVWFGIAWMIIVFPLTALFFFITKQGGIRDLWSHSTKVFSPNGMTIRSLLTSTVLFTFIWTGTNYMYVRALMSISATDVTALFSSAPAFVFILSIFILKEPPLILRLGSVLLVITGIILFAYVDGFKSANIIGVVLSVGSAIGAALYKVLLKWRVGDSSIYQMALFLSAVGLFSTIVLWPLLLILHYAEVELLVDIPWKYTCTSSALGLVFNFSINFGIAYTFPLFISIGTILGIPLNAVLDVWLHKINFLSWKFTATDLIVGGFMLMLIPPSDSQYIQKSLVSCTKCKRFNIN